MKFYKYLSEISKNEEDSILRSISFDIVESSDEHKLEETISNDPRAQDIVSLLEELNILLKRSYKGSKYKFGLCLKSTNNIQKIKIDDKIKKNIKKRWLEYNQKLSSIQYEIENEMGS